MRAHLISILNVDRNGNPLFTKQGSFFLLLANVGTQLGNNPVRTHESRFHQWIRIEWKMPLLFRAPAGNEKKKKLTASEVWGIFAGHSHLGSANRKQHIVTTTAVKTIQFLLNVSLQVFFSAARECFANGLPRR